MTMTAMLARLALGRNYSSGRGTEEPVAGVTQPRHDEAVLVQVLVHGHACHLHRRMMAAKQVESRLGRDQAERMDLGGAPFLDEVADPHQRTSRRQHRVATFTIGAPPSPSGDGCKTGRGPVGTRSGRAHGSRWRPVP